MKLLLNLELIGIKPDISLKGRPHYQTFWGFSLTLGIIFFTIFNSWETIIKYTSKTFPMFSENYEKDNHNMTFSIRDNTPIMFSYAFLDIANGGEVKDIILDDYTNNRFSPFATYVEKNKTSQINKLLFDLEKCNLSEIDLKLKNSTDPADIEYWENLKEIAKISYCFPNDGTTEVKYNEAFTSIDEENNTERYLTITINKDTTRGINELIKANFLI